MLSSQLLISAAMLVLVVAVLLLDPASLTNPGLFGGIGLIFVLTAVAALVPWGELPKWWGLSLPFLDIVAIIVIRDSAPLLGAELLLVFPILWLARSFGARETVAGFVVAMGLVVTSRIIHGDPLELRDFATLVLLPILLAFVATSVTVSTSRARAQTVLLRQHARFIETALERARRQEELRDAVLNAVDFGVIAFDRDHRVTFVNSWQRRALAEFGTPPDAVVHPVVYQADAVTPFADDQRPFRRALAGQSFDGVIFWVGQPGGRRAAYSASARALVDVHGGYDGGVLVLRDVTTELDAVRARDDLIGSVTHELRSPLTSVLGYLDLARDDERLGDETRRMLDIAATNSERLLVIVTDLLQAASDAQQRLEVTLVPTDLVEIARDAVDAHRLLADERGIALELDAPVTAAVTADPVRLRQVLDNLITNAVKYNVENGSVRVRVLPARESIALEVADTGPGIPASDLPRIFDRFYRTSSARDSRTVGSGLGLAVAREIVERHGGELTASSRVGRGATFRMTIPVGRSTMALDPSWTARA